MEAIAQLYRHILEVALRPQSQAGASIALVAGAQTDTVDADRPHQTPTLSTEFLPRDIEIQGLPEGEESVARVQAVLTEKRPNSVILIAPYLSAKHLSHAVRLKYPQADLAEIVLLVAMEKLVPGSLLGALLPRNVISSDRALRVRQQLYQNAQLRYVIDLGISRGVVFQNVHPSLDLQVLILEAGDGKQSGVRFFKIPEVQDQVHADRILSDFKRLTLQGGGETEYGYVLRQELTPEDKLLFELHQRRLKQRVEDMRHLGLLVELGTLVEILRSNEIPLPEAQSTKRSTSEVSTPILNARDIRPDGSIDVEGANGAGVSRRSSLLLKANDICIRQIQGLQSDGLVAALVTPDILPRSAGRHILILRLMVDSQVNQDYLINYLRSKRVTEWLLAQGTGMTLSPSILSKLPTPIPDQELINALAGLKEAENTFYQWQLESQSAMSALFDYESARDARLHILSTGRMVKQRHVAGLQVQDLGYRVRNQFPHPVAFRWRTVEAAKTDLEGYLQVLECAEAVLCYLANLAILSVQAVDGGKIGYLGNMADRLYKFGHGTNMGDWMAILREVQSSKALRKTSDLAPFYEVHRFLDNGDVGDAVARLKKLRDAQSHGRGPKGRKVVETFDEALRMLRILVDAGSFLSEYPLWYVETTKRDALMRTTTLQYRDIMGDHPYVPVKTCEVSIEDVEAESLYAVEQSGKLHLFRPLLSRRECPICGSWSTFYLDSYRQSDDVCVLKSMEHGHTLDDQQSSEAFRLVGLLPGIDNAKMK